MLLSPLIGTPPLLERTKLLLASDDLVLAFLVLSGVHILTEVIASIEDLFSGGE